MRRTNDYRNPADGDPVAIVLGLLAITFPIGALLAVGALLEALGW